MCTGVPVSVLGTSYLKVRISGQVGNRYLPDVPTPEFCGEQGEGGRRMRAKFNELVAGHVGNDHGANYLPYLSTT